MRFWLITFIAIGCAQVEKKKGMHYAYFTTGVKLSNTNSSGTVRDFKEKLGKHYLEVGGKVALILNTYDKGAKKAVDDEMFSKLTLIIDRIEKRNFSIKEDNIIGYFSKGSSSWVKAIQSGKVVSGYIDIKEIGYDSLLVEINLKIKILDRENADASIKVDGSYSFKKVPNKRLSPWMGKPGKTTYSEVTPESP